ncbi:MAG: ABC transporter ATP-binding protein [Deltaproteobacteria bacterium]|nr:MAG: ABC transporter ATP-binding protein [Deltaproteobacteria bacterium]
MDNIAIRIRNLSKIYTLYQSPQDRLKEALHFFGKKYHQKFSAISDISLDVEKGGILGIIGVNGAGKSTLLKLITGVLTPTSGHIEVRGRIASLLELGAGFNPEMTGRQNIYLNGTVMGLSRQEIDEKIESIIEFADIGDFIEQPVKSYSSGMFARLAFSVAINVDPDILIVDEALSVGDIRFQQKSLRRMKSFIDMEKTVLFVTHDMGIITSFCHKALWLHGGAVREYGEPDVVTKNYLSLAAYGLETVASVQEEAEQERAAAGREEKASPLSWLDLGGCESFGEGGGTICEAALYNEDRQEMVTVLHGGECLSCYLKIQVTRPIEEPIIGFQVKNKFVNIFGINSYKYGLPFGPLREDTIIRLRFSFPTLGNGKYLVNISLADGTQLNHVQEHFIYDALEIEVANSALECIYSNLFVVDRRTISFERVVDPV